MFKHDIGQEILEGVREIKPHKLRKKILHTLTLQEPLQTQVISPKKQKKPKFNTPLTPR